MVVNKYEKMVLTLQLIKSDGLSVEEDATISFKIYDSSATVELVSAKTATYNANTKSYIYDLDPETEWTTQEVGTYLIIWSVSNTDDDFHDTYTEDLQVNIDKVLIDKILGLVHQNMVIDETVFDAWHNLESARVVIYKDSTKTDILQTYRINTTTTGPGQFSSWEQVEE